MKKIGVKIFTVLGFLQMVMINSLANILPINGMTTGDLSDKLRNLFTPQETNLRFIFGSEIYDFHALISRYFQKSQCLKK